MEKLLTYAIKDKKLVHISEVQNGDNCGCICPNSECKEPLRAVANIESKEYKKEAHFSHQQGSNCPGAYESALHLLVKDVFAETKEIFVPDFHHDYNPENPYSIYGTRGKIVSFDSVILEKEKKIEDEKFKPDAIAFKKEKTLYIEFAVTHFCDEKKLNKIKKANIPAIEVKIDPKTTNLDPVYLKKFLLEDDSAKKFLFNPTLEENYKKEQQEKLEEEKLKQIESIKKEENRIRNLIQCKKYNILKVQGKEVSLCPKNDDFINYIKNSKYYFHPEIKKLANGSFWNGEFYGHINSAKYIFIDGERVITSSIDENHTQFRERELLFRGLMEFKRRNEKSVDNCNRCSYRKGVNTINGEDYVTCSYVTNSNPIIEAKIQ
ncbi:hypothetical protein [Algoriphagus namhaensis]